MLYMYIFKAMTSSQISDVEPAHHSRERPPKHGWLKRKTHLEDDAHNLSWALGMPWDVAMSVPSKV